LPELAPIGVSTYSRLRHLKETIAALRNNTLATESELFIFSDAPKPGDEEMVSSVRDYIHTIDGFRDVQIVERKTNSRIENNREGHKMLLAQYGRIIFLEDDIVTAPGFLAFMNGCLTRFEDCPEITSITGYSLPIQLPADHKEDFFVIPRFCAWGMGIWADRYDAIKDIKPSDLDFALKNKRDFVEKLGWDALIMLRRETMGEVDLWDLKAMYHNWANGKVTVYPRESLVSNIGHDNSGVHYGKSRKFDVVLSSRTTFDLGAKPELNLEILQANEKFYHANWWALLRYTLESKRSGRALLRLYSFLKKHYINLTNARRR